MNTDTIQNVHGHAIMHLLAASENPLPRKKIQSAVEAQVGQNVRFYTCSAEDLTLDGLLEFLLNRGKIIETAQGYAFNPGAQACNHDGGH